MYLKQIEHKIHENISNESLMSCARIAELVKEPPVIPYYEAFTFSLLARYFGLTEKRLRNAYKSNRQFFWNDCTQVTGAKMLHYVKDVKNLGMNYGYLCEFVNGVVVQVSYTTNMLFNYRALLNFAIILKTESDVAKQIYEILHKNEYHYKGYLNQKNPWFAEIKEEPPMVCPYAAMTGNHKPHGDRRNTVRVNQLDEHGNTVYVWDSASEAANVLGINKSSVYNCLQGKCKTASGGKYRFAYAE